MKQWRLRLKDGTVPYATVIATSRAQAREIFLREYPDRERLPKGSTLEQINENGKRHDYRGPYIIERLEPPRWGPHGDQYGPVTFNIRDASGRVRGQRSDEQVAITQAQEWGNE